MNKTYTPAIIKNLQNALKESCMKQAIQKVELQNDHLRLRKMVTHYLNLADDYNNYKESVNEVWNGGNK